MSLNLCLINGSPNGSAGNTAHVLEIVRSHLTQVRVSELVLLNATFDDMYENLAAADAFVFATGTYWDSWGSPLQRFLEIATEWETGPVFLGKPAAVIVSAHAVGGKAVLSRLQGVLNSLGCLIPPLGGLVLSKANQLAIEHADPGETLDLWRPSDIEHICANLVRAAGTNRGVTWNTWPVESSDVTKVWLK